MEALGGLWPRIVGDVPLFLVAVDVRANGLRVEVAPENVSRVEAALPTLAQALDVHVRAVAGEPYVADVCQTRSNCHSPMRAGILIRKGSKTGSICSQGFHVVRNGDYQFLTAGHCGYSGSNTWYHTGYCCAIGSETDTAFQHLGDDIMWVNMPNTGQASDNIYGGPSDIIAFDFPRDGQAVCVSRGNTGGLPDCGTVTDAVVQYVLNDDNLPDWTLTGARTTGIGAGGGDSGSPYYAKVGTSGAVDLGFTVVTVAGSQSLGGSTTCCQVEVGRW